MRRIFLILAATQVAAWGTMGLPAVLGRAIAADIHASLETVFAGTSVLFVVVALWSPVLGEALVRIGPRLVMVGGSVLAGLGFAALALSTGPITYLASWLVLGTAGAATLTTPAHVQLTSLAGARARSAIGAMMLATGLSSSIFWPLSAWLAGLVGWRGTAALYAVLLAGLCAPLLAFGLPRGRPAPEPGPGASLPKAASPGRVGTFPLIAAAIALFAFVTYGLSATMIELLKAEGLGPEQAVAVGSALGVVQVSARALDMLGGARWDGLTTGLVAGAALPAAMLLLAAGGGASWSIAAFILIYGMGSGALAVARATIPLVFYEKAAYARAAARIALPLNIMSALAPPVLVGLLGQLGPRPVLVLTAGASCAAMLMLLQLRSRRPAPRAPVAA